MHWRRCHRKKKKRGGAQKSENRRSGVNTPTPTHTHAGNTSHHARGDETKKKRDGEDEALITAHSREA